MKNTLGTLFLVLAFAPFAQAAAPQVTVTSFEQVGRRVEITYDLAADGIVTADIVTNDVSIGAQFLTGMYGDVNKAIAAGTGKKIYWSPEASLNKTFYNAYAKLTAWALDAPPNYCVLDLAIKSNVTYYVSAEAVPLGVTNNIYKTERMVLRKIPAKGVQFRMGTAGNTTDEIPHRVTFTNDFYLGIYELTQNQATRMFSNAGKWSYFTNDTDYLMHPLDSAMMGAARSSTLESPLKQGGVLTSDSNNGVLSRMDAFTGMWLDLPTESQWEYACRAGSGDKYYWGSAGDIDDYAWHSGNSGGKTHAVGLKAPNAWGLYDMCGNVRERCLDLYYTGADYSDGSDVVEPADRGFKEGAGMWLDNRSVRGGSWDDTAENCRSAYRDKYVPRYENARIGYRIWMRPQAYVK